MENKENIETPDMIKKGNRWNTCNEDGYKPAFFYMDIIIRNKNIKMSKNDLTFSDFH